MQIKVYGYQKYNSELKDSGEQTRLLLFYCKDRDSFEDCLRESDVIPTKEERARIRKQLADTTHAKLMLKTDQPPVYKSYNIIYHLFNNCFIAA